MSEPLALDYYYGAEADQFTFYRVPRLLIKDERYRDLSNDAKLLYGLMLDRMALSIRNGWTDEQNRAYVIYTIEQIAEDLNCGRDKAIHVLSELDQKKGIGLVEKVRRGLGKPDIIYIKNFASNAKTDAVTTCEPTEVGKADFKKSENATSRSLENRLQEVGKTDFKKSDNPTSASRENRPLEIGKADPIYTNMNNTDLSQNKINLINPSRMLLRLTQDERQREMEDGMDDEASCLECIRKNIDYDFVMKHGELKAKEFYEETYRIIQDALCPKREIIRFGGADYPHEQVKQRFLELRAEHMQYVLTCLQKSTSKKHNIKGYILSCLYSAPTTINQYYQQEVQHDMYGGGWNG